MLCNNSIFVNFIQEAADSSWNFDEVILEAAKSIAAATSALVKAASAAQRELIDSGKVKYLCCIPKFNYTKFMSMNIYIYLYVRGAAVGILIVIL